MKILVVKLSSFGDVVHTLPILTDIASIFPEAKVDWVVEESFVPLLTRYQQNNPTLLNRVIACGLRRWRKQLFHPSTYGAVRAEFRVFRQQLKQGEYDLVLDVQGLIKSAWIASLARTNKNKNGNNGKQTKIYGFKNGGIDSGYEPLARLVYDVSIPIPDRIHAVSRSRYFFAQVCEHLGVKNNVSTAKPDFGLIFPRIDSPFNTKKVLLVMHTAGKHKQWKTEHWVGLAKYLIQQGYCIEWSWGSQAEQTQSQQLIRLSGGELAAQRDLNQWCDHLPNYALVVGVDTGLTHLAAALNVKTIELYVASWRWKTECFWSERIVNLGDCGAPPSLDIVIESINQLCDFQNNKGVAP
jgi:heptosyltransferase-1